MNTWYIPDGYVPYEEEHGDAPIGHEAIAVMNRGTEPCELHAEVWFLDREPMKGFTFTIRPERSHRIIMGTKYVLEGGMRIPVPENTAYSLKLTSEGDLAIQFSRMDTRSARISLFSVPVAKE